MESSILVFNNASSKFISVLQAFGTPECVMAAEPFLCLYLFGGVCDGNRTHFLPTREECLEISTEVCRTEWELVGNATITLPNCAILPRQDSVNCSVENSSSSGKNEACKSIMHAILATLSLTYCNEILVSTLCPPDLSPNCTRNCRDKFYCDERGLCVPLCSKWNIYPLPVSIAFDVVTILCSIIGGVSAIVILVNCCLRFKRM